jgi:hypothetical protein
MAVLHTARPLVAVSRTAMACETVLPTALSCHANSYLGDPGRRAIPCNLLATSLVVLRSSQP